MEKKAAKTNKSLEDAVDRCQALVCAWAASVASFWNCFGKQSTCQLEKYMIAWTTKAKAIGHTSVYQNLEALSSQGIIECIERSDGRCTGISAILIAMWTVWIPNRF